MQFSRTVFEISLVFLTLLVLGATIVFLNDPSVADFLTIAGFCWRPIVFLSLVIVASARMIPCTWIECVGYARVVCFALGAMFAAIGLFLTLTSADEHFANSLSVLLVGLVTIFVSHVVKRWTGVSCTPQLKSLFDRS